MITKRREILVLAGIFVVSFWLFFHFRNPFIGQWDSFDYAWQIVKHRPSELFLGRLYFLGYNIVIWELAKKLFHFQPGDAYKVIQLVVILMASLTLIVHYIFVKLFLNADVALVSTLFLMTSPIFIVFGGCIMTEVPMLLFLLSGFAMFFFGVRKDKWRYLILGSSLVGFSVGVREQAVFFFPLLMILPFFVNVPSVAFLRGLVGSLCAIFVASLGPLLFLALDYQRYADQFHHWSANVRPNYAVNLSTLKPVLLYTFANSPASVVLSIAAIVFILLFRTKRRTGQLAYAQVLPEQEINPNHVLTFFFAASVLPLIFLLPDPDLMLHPRYELCAIPGFTVLAAVFLVWCFKSARVLRYVVAVLICVLVLWLSAKEINAYNESQREKKVFLESLLKSTPGDAIIIGGLYTPMIEYCKQVEIRPEWGSIKSGWDWPKHDLPYVVQRHLSRHRPVFLISDPNAWVNLEPESRDTKSLGMFFQLERVLPGLERISPNEHQRADD